MVRGCCNLRIGVKYEVTYIHPDMKPIGCNLRIGVKYEVRPSVLTNDKDVATYA